MLKIFMLRQKIFRYLLGFLYILTGFQSYIKEIKPKIPAKLCDSKKMYKIKMADLAGPKNRKGRHKKIKTPHPVSPTPEDTQKRLKREESPSKDPEIERASSLEK